MLGCAATRTAALLVEDAALKVKFGRAQREAEREIARLKAALEAATDAARAHSQQEVISKQARLHYPSLLMICPMEARHLLLPPTP